MTPHLTDTPVLETERLTLRAPALQDAATFMAFYQTERSQYVGGPMAPRMAGLFFGSEIGHWALNGFGMFIVARKDDDTAIGLVGHWYPHDWPEKEVGWLMLDPAVEGKGYAYEAAQACITHAWTALNWPTIVSYIHPDNARSIALAERLGAVRDAKATPPKSSNPDAPAALVYRHPKPENLS